jgi:hypothetical protein
MFHGESSVVSPIAVIVFLKPNIFSATSGRVNRIYIAGQLLRGSISAPGTASRPIDWMHSTGMRSEHSKPKRTTISRGLTSAGRRPNERPSATAQSAIEAQAGQSPRGGNTPMRDHKMDRHYFEDRRETDEQDQIV